MKKVLICLMVVFGQPYATAQEITRENWLNHPKIKAIRTIYQEINRSELKPIRKTCETNDGAVRIIATLYLDKNEQVRKYQIEGGTEDSSANVTYYYSKLGKHRFTFETLQAVNGTHSERRIYFDAQGKNYRNLQHNRIRA